MKESEIRKYLDGKLQGCPLKVFDCVESTNTLAKQYVRDLRDSGVPIPEFMIFAAGAQTGGRGRTGKHFFSPPGGLYLTCVLDMHMKAEQGLLLTPAAAVAACRVLEQYSDKSIGIKWVNDLLSDGKKVCGILTEAICGEDTGFIEYAVTGIGLNIDTPAELFPEELRETASSVHLVKGDRNSLAGDLASELYRIKKEIGSGILMEEYRRRSVVIGKTILWEEKGKTLKGRAVDIDNEGRLLAETSDGILRIGCGMVSIYSENGRF